MPLLVFFYFFYAKHSRNTHTHVNDPVYPLKFHQFRQGFFHYDILIGLIFIAYVYSSCPFFFLYSTVMLSSCLSSPPVRLSRIDRSHPSLQTTVPGSCTTKSARISPVIFVPGAQRKPAPLPCDVNWAGERDSSLQIRVVFTVRHRNIPPRPAR